MNKELKDYHDMIDRSKKEGEGPCGNCALRRDNGPALIECADESPEIVVVSESPAGKPEATKDIKQWTRSILISCHENFLKELPSARNMGHFIGRLTRGKVYCPDDPERTHNLYWTHTLKCFIQNEDIGIRDAKRKRGKHFRSGIKECSKYLADEIRKANPKPKTVIAVGREAARKLEGSGFTLYEVYHPSSWKSKEQKKSKLKLLRDEVVKLGLEDLAPGCIDLDC